MCCGTDIKNGRCTLIAGHNEIHILLKLKDTKREQNRLDQSMLMYKWKKSTHEINSSTTTITQLQNLGTFLYKMKCSK